MYETRLNKAHTGEYLAAKLVKSLKDYTIEDKVMQCSFSHVHARLTMCCR